MNDNTTRRRIKTLLLIVLIIGSVRFIWGVIDQITFRMEQNIYFTEFNGSDTIIFKYDSMKRRIIELVKVPGRLNGCVVDKEENRITGFLHALLSEGGHCIDIIEYDIKSGTVTEKNVIKKIDELTGDTSWDGILYDGGDKILVSYMVNDDVEHMLSYDLETGKTEDVLISEKKISKILQYPAIDEQALWYRHYNAIYRYDWQTMTERVISYSSDYVVLEPNAGLMAYIDYSSDTSSDEIFIYDINRNKTSRITTAGWNIHYGDLLQTNAMWTNDGRQFCYVKSFPLMFNAANRSLMIYDLKSGKHRCIYKLRNTTSHFEYVLYQ